MKNLRLRNGNLQVPTLRFFNPMTRRYFHLIGVCHLSSPEFWETTNERVETLRYAFPDAEVHHEGVRDNTPDKVLTLDKERNAFTRFGDALGLPYQSKGLHMEKDWICTDLTLTEILDRLQDPDAFIEKHRKAVASFTEFAEVVKDSPWGKKASRFVFRHLLAFYVPRKNDEYRVIIDTRNHYAVSTMVSTGTDIITLWGAGHLKGMRKILEGCGYELISTDWATCVPRRL